jgi:hypothetical protein
MLGPRFSAFMKVFKTILNIFLEVHLAFKSIMKQLDLLGGNSILLLLHALLSIQGEGKHE